MEAGSTPGAPATGFSVRGAGSPGAGIGDRSSTSKAAFAFVGLPSIVAEADTCQNPGRSKVTSGAP